MDFLSLEDKKILETLTAEQSLVVFKIFNQLLQRIQAQDTALEIYFKQRADLNDKVMNLIQLRRNIENTK
jgi:hypothetical protein